MSRLNVHEFGDPAGSPLLAVHGIMAHGRRFRRLAEEAWPERRTIAIDLRGHGRSTWDGPWSIAQHVTDLLDTLDELGIDSADVLGHSYGGAIGVALLARVPERVQRLVLLDPAVAQPGELGSRFAAETIAHQGWASVDDATAGRSAGLQGDVDAAVAEDVAEHLVLGDDGRYRFRFHKPAVITGWGEVCQALPTRLEHRPTLLVVADQAGLVTAAVEAELHHLLDPALTVVHLDCGHMLYWERFDDTAGAVTGFLRR